jgi:hypothetical protein
MFAGGKTGNQTRECQTRKTQKVRENSNRFGHDRICLGNKKPIDTIKEIRDEAHTTRMGTYSPPMS